MLRRVSLHPAPSFRPLGGLSAGARDGAAQLGSLPLRGTAPLRGISTHRTPSASVWSLLGKRSTLLRQPARRLATESSDAKKQPKDEEQKQEQQQKEEKKEEEERKEEKQEDQHREKEEWEKEREKRGGYKQDVNTFQKVLAVVVPLAALAIGVKTLLDLRGQGMEDDTLQVDMNAVMSHVFQTTVYNVLDSKKLIATLGDPLLVEPTKAKFSFTKDFAWISYPLYGPHGHICTVTVDVLRVDPTKESVKLKKPHMWYVAQIEVDMSNGKKVRMSTKMEGVKQPFNVLHLYHKILEDLKKQEADYLRQQAAAEAGASLPS